MIIMTVLCLWLTTSISQNCSETYINSLDKCYIHRAIMEDILAAKPEYWKQRFKRAIKGEFLAPSNSNTLRFASRKEINEIIKSAAEFGVDLK